MPDSNDFLTLPEVAALLKVAEKTIYGLAQKGALPAFKVGGQWRFSREAIDSWVEAEMRAAGATQEGDGPKPSGPMGED